MLRPIDQWFNRQPEPARACLLVLRDHIRSPHAAIEEAWKYGMPFFCISGRMFCYLWIQRKNGWPYLGIVEGGLLEDPDLISEKRARMKILVFDPNIDIPIHRVNQLLDQLLRHYGVIT